MKYFLTIVLLILLVGPLRPWFKKHWAFILSVTFGAVTGWVLGCFVAGHANPPNQYLPLIWSLVMACACGNGGPRILRQIQKDGKDE